MTYKIVQTVERGKNNLVIIPHMWEENGCLWWPPKKLQQKLIKDEHSKPNQKEWRLIKCSLKRHGIRTYELAEAELTIMEENSDTDADIAPRTTEQIENVLDYEVVANNLIYDHENQGNTTNRENIVELSTETVNYDQILANQKIISEKIDNMLQMQAITLDNQQKIAQQLATQSVQLEEISVQLAAVKEGPSVTLLKDANPVDNESFTLKPIENQRDLISLDQLLADKAGKSKLQRQLLFLCSASKGEGKTCAYKLLDVLFTRDFLCNCSWAGGSRGDRSKIAFKDYKNVLKFFHGMIQSWDPTYTVQDNETFFKIVTKNSRQRQSMKNLRMSSKRCRRKKDNLDKQQNSGNESQPNDDKKETEGENMQIQEYALNDDFKEITVLETIPIQEPEREKENIPLNDISDDDIEDSLC